jgi:hypothetical protein
MDIRQFHGAVTRHPDRESRHFLRADGGSEMQTFFLHGLDPFRHRNPMGNLLQQPPDLAEDVFDPRDWCWRRRGSGWRRDLRSRDGIRDDRTKTLPGGLNETKFSLHLCGHDLRPLEVVSRVPPGTRNADSVDGEMHVNVGLVSVDDRHPLMVLQAHAADVGCGDFCDELIPRILGVSKRKGVVHYGFGGSWS